MKFVEIAAKVEFGSLEEGTSACLCSLLMCIRPPWSAPSLELHSPHDDSLNNRTLSSTSIQEGTREERLKLNVSRFII